MSAERVAGAAMFIAGGAYFVVTLVVAPATEGVSLIFGLLVGGALGFAGREMWRD